MILQHVPVSANISETVYFTNLLYASLLKYFYRASVNFYCDKIQAEMVEKSS